MEKGDCKKLDGRGEHNAHVWNEIRQKRWLMKMIEKEI